MVVVDGKPLPLVVHPATAERFVVAPFNAKSTRFDSVSETNRHGETSTQKWPSTPFDIAITNGNKYDVSAEIFVNGARVTRKCARVRSTRTASGFEFTIPRICDEKTKCDTTTTAAEAAEMGSIRVELRRAVFAGMVNTGKKKSAPAPVLGVVNKEVAKRKGVAATVTRAVPASSSSTTKSSWSYKEHLGQIVLRYGTREELEMRGVLAATGGSSVAAPALSLPPPSPLPPPPPPTQIVDLTPKPETKALPAPTQLVDLTPKPETKALPATGYKKTMPKEVVDLM